MKRFVSMLLLVTLGAVGCVDDNPAYAPNPDLPDQCRRGVEVSETFEGFERPQKLDILVVVDNSGDIVPEQERLASALPGFLETLADRDISVRLGVVTADASSAGGLAPAGVIGEGCQNNNKQIAESSQGGWTEVAACNVVQGNSGQPRQQALEVIETSVADRPGTLESFFREQARLLVIVLSNEDDCSSPDEIGGEDTVRNECVWSAGRLSKVSTYVDSVREQFQTPEGVALAVFSGPPSDREVARGEAVRPVCQGTLGAAYPANRLYEAAQAFGQQGYFQSLCTDDLGFGLSEVADELVGPPRTTLCPAETLVHEPLEVVARGGGEENQVPLGEGGFLFFGPTGACETGALSFAAPALAGAEAVDVRYCINE